MSLISRFFWEPVEFFWLKISQRNGQKGVAIHYYHQGREVPFLARLDSGPGSIHGDYFTSFEHMGLLSNRKTHEFSGFPYLR